MKIPSFLEEQLKQESAAVQAAFLEAFEDIKDSIVFDRVVAAITAGDFDLAIRELHIDPEFFDEFTQALQNAYRNAGRTALKGVPQTVVRFDGRHLRAEAWASTLSSTLVTAIVAEQREAVRVIISEGVRLGAGPRNTALNIVGRINRSTGKREGGIIGLTSQQTEYVVNARRELTSGQTSDLRNYLNRALRDKRYDSAVRKAIASGNPIELSKVEVMIARYEGRMLKYRGEVVARTETLTALNAGRAEAMTQLVEKTDIPKQRVKKIWRATGADGRTRETHLMMEGQTRGMDEPFETPGGYRLLSPGDKSLGAPPEETIQCRCWVEYKIDYLGMING